MRTDENHDTDPAPAPKGNGHGDPNPYPCTVHAAELVLLRDSTSAMTRTLDEIRIAVKAISGQLGDEIEARKKWAGEVEFALLEQANGFRALTAVIGEPPDQTTGKPGTGMRGQWVSAINAVIKSSTRRELPSLTADESDVTGVMDRESLVIRARKAERDRHVMLVRAVVAGVLAIIGALVTAAVTLIPLLRQG